MIQLPHIGQLKLSGNSHKVVDFYVYNLSGDWIHFVECRG